jgi:hypothetical protein
MALCSPMAVATGFMIGLGQERTLRAGALEPPTGSMATLGKTDFQWPVASQQET